VLFHFAADWHFWVFGDRFSLTHTLGGCTMVVSKLNMGGIKTSGLLKKKKWRKKQIREK